VVKWYSLVLAIWQSALGRGSIPRGDKYFCLSFLLPFQPDRKPFMVVSHADETLALSTGSRSIVRLTILQTALPPQAERMIGTKWTSYQDDRHQPLPQFPQGPSLMNSPPNSSYSTLVVPTCDQSATVRLHSAMPFHASSLSSPRLGVRTEKDDP
jgi:hypothetical protein